jgi:hypothetical protein
MVSAFWKSNSNRCGAAAMADPAAPHEQRHNDGCGDGEGTHGERPPRRSKAGAETYIPWSRRVKDPKTACVAASGGRLAEVPRSKPESPGRSPARRPRRIHGRPPQLGIRPRGNLWSVELGRLQQDEASWRCQARDTEHARHKVAVRGAEAVLEAKSLLKVAFSRSCLLSILIQSGCCGKETSGGRTSA